MCRDNDQQNHWDNGVFSIFRQSHVGDARDISAGIFCSPFLRMKPEVSTFGDGDGVGDGGEDRHVLS